MRKPNNAHKPWTREELFTALAAGQNKYERTALDLERSPGAVAWVFYTYQAAQRGSKFKAGYGRGVWNLVQEYLKEQGNHEKTLPAYPGVSVALPKPNGLYAAPSEPKPDKEEQVLEDIDKLVKQFGASLRDKIVDLAQVYMEDERQSYQTQIARLEAKTKDLENAVAAAKKSEWMQGIREGLLREQ